MVFRFGRRIIEKPDSDRNSRGDPPKESVLADAEREVKHCRKHGIEIIASTDAFNTRPYSETADYPHVLAFWVPGSARQDDAYDGRHASDDSVRAGRWLTG